LVHGRKLTEAAATSGWEIERFVASESYAASVALPSEDTAVLADGLFAKLSDQPSPEGILAVVRRPRLVLPDTELAGPAVLVWQLNDPGNLGALLRIAAWFGFSGVWLSPGSVDPFGPKAVRGSMGAVFTVPCGVVEAFEGLVERFAGRIAAAAVPAEGRASRSDVGAARPTAAALAPKQLHNSGRDLLLLGSESHGLPESLLTLPGIATVSIASNSEHPPESLNVAVAAGILCYAWAH
jgi:RNA methyltransferase, TrmH family